MKKILLISILIFFGLGKVAFAETGKNLNWCNTDTKIKYPFSFFVPCSAKVKPEVKIRQIKTKNIFFTAL